MYALPPIALEIANITEAKHENELQNQSHLTDRTSNRG